MSDNTVGVVLILAISLTMSSCFVSSDWRAVELARIDAAKVMKK